jgi:2-methylcitrate dehydratase PrpD
MLSIPGVTEQLARFVVETRCDALPSHVVHQAKRSLLNFFAVALTGCRVETIETAFAKLARFSGGRQATLIGRRERIDALSAAFLNVAGVGTQAREEEMFWPVYCWLEGMRGRG